MQQIGQTFTFFNTSLKNSKNQLLNFTFLQKT